MLVFTIYDTDDGNSKFVVHLADDGDIADVTDQFEVRSMNVEHEDGTVSIGWHVGQRALSDEPSQET